MSDGPAPVKAAGGKTTGRKTTGRKTTRRTRMRLNPRPFLVSLVFANLVAGAFYSPLTAIRRVRVEGAPVALRSDLDRVLQKMRGVPCAQVQARALESEVLRNPELRSASLARTPFGTAVLRVEARTAVAEVGPRQRVGLTDDGVVYASSVPLDGLPKVTLPDDAPRVSLTLGNGWRAVDVARLATLVRAVPAQSPIGIVLDRGGRVCLNIDTGSVDLGTLDGLDAKVSRLRGILAERPDLFSTVAVLHLVDVDAPTYTPRPSPSRRRS